jgi:ABC-type nitrate/sulfonate/bicarbonate transport system ATPase subunit
MPPSTPKLYVDDASMTFKTPTGVFHALAPVTLSIPKGRFVSLIGPSGCGKSTIFNIIAGLLEPTGGRVMIDGVDATGTIGRVGYMLQKDLLLPWRTVLDNTILGMEIQGVALRQARERALPLLHRYGLSGFEYLYPNSLSGGMRQRAALLRTLLFDTDVILLDEPFGALDAQTKLQMQEWLLQLWSDCSSPTTWRRRSISRTKCTSWARGPAASSRPSRSRCRAHAYARARSPLNSSP